MLLKLAILTSVMLLALSGCTNADDSAAAEDDDVCLYDGNHKINYKVV